MSEVVYFITEGATEREVGLVLHKRHLLKGAKPKSGLARISREGYEQVVKAIRDQNVLQALEGAPGLGLLLIFDQDQADSPRDRANKLGKDLGLSFNSFIDCEHDNVFWATSKNGLKIVLHVSNVAADGIKNCDFDGYILQLLQGPHKEAIAERIVPGDHDHKELLRKAEKEITKLMRDNGFFWHRNKSWLYAYITAFQFRKSHVWFSAEVVQHAPESELKRVFSSLIDAWDLLIRWETLCRLARV
ncbi:MAG: hypothetical protein J7L69_10545 [Desulfobulbaceae bacterium]|nr:hypothetical protein [Desulfobulbaceae bacterium]